MEIRVELPIWFLVIVLGVMLMGLSDDPIWIISVGIVGVAALYYLKIIALILGVFIYLINTFDPLWVVGIVIACLIAICSTKLFVWFTGITCLIYFIKTYVPMWIVGIVLGGLLAMYYFWIFLLVMIVGCLAYLADTYDPISIIGIASVVVCIFYYIEKFTKWFQKYYGFVLSIRNILEEIQCKKLLPLKDFTTINLHIVSKYPLFNREPWWEQCMVNLPKYNKDIVNTVILNLVFIVECEEPFKPIFTSSKTILSRGRIVTYTMKQMFYHMYYSSPDYIEPDAILVYNPSTMLGNKDEAIHREISFRNMVSNENAVLVLLDETQEKVKQGVDAVVDAQPHLFVYNCNDTTSWDLFHFSIIQKIENVDKQMILKYFR